MNIVTLGRRFGGKKLPYDAEVECIIADGRQYITINDNFDQKNFAFEVDFKITDLQKQVRFFAGGSYIAAYVNGSYKYGYAYNTTWAVANNTTIAENVRTKFKLDYYAKKSYVNGAATTSINQGNQTSSYLRILTLGGSNPSFVGNLYGFKMLKNGELIYDLIPVRKDGVGYMYDTLSKVIYGSKTEYPFLYGSDI